VLLSRLPDTPDSPVATSAAPSAPAKHPTSTEHVGLFGQPLPTSVHTYETSLQPEPACPSRQPPLNLGSGDFDLPPEVLERAELGWRVAQPPIADRPGNVAIATPGELQRRHGWWEQRRKQVREALFAAGFSPARIDRFDNCGASTFVLVEKAAPHRHRRASNKCRDRHCEPCSIDRANKYAANLKKYLSQYKGRLNRRFRFVTLTLASKPCPYGVEEPLFLQAEMRRLIKSITKLRRVRLCFLKSRKLKEWWSHYVLGGCYFIEATLNHETGLWHVHAHLIVEGAFLPQHELASLWQMVTGDSSVVDVRQLTGIDEAAAEVSKYVAKGADKKLACDGSKLVAWMVGTKSLRLCSTFGTWRGVRLAAPLDDFQPGAWANLGREDDIRRLMALGDEWAKRVITALEADTSTARKRRPPPKIAKVAAMDGL